jgi:hypothetical protein
MARYRLLRAALFHVRPFRPRMQLSFSIPSGRVSCSEDTAGPASPAWLPRRWRCAQPTDDGNSTRSQTRRNSNASRFSRFQILIIRNHDSRVVFQNQRIRVQSLAVVGIRVALSDPRPSRDQKGAVPSFFQYFKEVCTLPPKYPTPPSPAHL